MKTPESTPKKAVRKQSLVDLRSYIVLRYERLLGELDGASYGSDSDFRRVADLSSRVNELHRLIAAIGLDMHSGLC